MNGKFVLKSSKVKQKKKLKKRAMLVLITLSFLLLVSYAVVGIIYNGGNFSISLDRNLHFENGLIIYDDPNYKVFRSELLAEDIPEFDNISYKWLPKDIDNYDGSHNGDNYVAYTFYIENLGEDICNYWSEILIDDVIKNVDEAVRVRVYKNGEYLTYAKIGRNGKAEKETVPFESETLIVRELVKDFKPGDKNKYTVVLWLEGSDPDCTDNILGGEIKIHMEFNSEIIQELEGEK